MNYVGLIVMKKGKKAIFSDLKKYKSLTLLNGKVLS